MKEKGDAPMSIDLTDAFCRNRLRVAKRNISKFKAYTEQEFGPIEWKEEDYRVRDEGGDVFLVLPYDEQKNVFYTDSEMSDFYEDGFLGMLALCEPGSYLEVIMTDYHRISRFDVREGGRVECTDADMVNPFSIFDTLAGVTHSRNESGQEA